MAASSDLLQSIACLGQAFPQYVQQQIAKLTDEFVATLQTLPNALGQVGDLGLGQLAADIAKNAAGDVLGAIGQVAGIVGQLASTELGSLIPSALTASTGNRAQDILNLGASVAGSAMLTLALVPETPFVLAQRMCETLSQLLGVELQTLSCLGKHILQLSNVMAVLVHLRPLATSVLAVDLLTVDGELNTAINELTASRRSRGGVLGFDGAAFDRGRAALERALRTLMPKLEGQSVLSLGSALFANVALPPELATPANARLALAAVSQLVFVIRKEALALEAQVSTIRYYLQQLKTVVTNYRATPAAQSVIALRLQTVSALVARVQDIEQSVHAARVADPAHASASNLVAWAVGLQAILALASSIRAGELIEGAVDAAVDAALKATYGALIEAINRINSAHVQEGADDVTDLVAASLGLCTQAELLVGRLGEVGTADSELRTFQVLVANTAIKMGGRLGESERAAVELQLACGPFLLLSIAARASVDKLLSALSELGLDRGRDLISSGQFAEFFGASFDNLSYTGSAISCLTEALAGIDDAGLRRQVAAIREDLIGQKTNELLSAADTVDTAGLRRTSAIQGELAALQASAQTISGIVDYLKSLAQGLSLDLSSIDSLGQMRFAGDTDFLAIASGGSLGTAVRSLGRMVDGVPPC